MFERYILREGENLFNVANKYNTTTNVISNLNNISGIDDLREGIELIVPVNSKEYFNYYVVESGDSLYKIARKYNINPELLANLNGLNFDDYIYPNQQLLIPKNGYSYYITAEGDTIDEVLRVFNSNLTKFFAENQTVYLMSGQLLVNKKN